MIHDNHRLVYFSKNNMKNLTDDISSSLSEIMRVSTRNNKLSGLNGMLFFSNEFFGQVLEGPKSMLCSTFERIQQDQRHCEALVLGFAACPKCIYDRWTMSFVGELTENSPKFNDTGIESIFNPLLITSDELLKCLYNMVIG